MIMRFKSSHHHQTANKCEPEALADLASLSPSSSSSSGSSHLSQHSPLKHTCYHLGCFKCLVCERHLQKGEEFVMRHEGIYCKQDFDAANSISNTYTMPNLVNRLTSKPRPAQTNFTGSSADHMGSAGSVYSRSPASSTSSISSIYSNNNNTSLSGNQLSGMLNCQLMKTCIFMYLPRATFLIRFY